MREAANGALERAREDVLAFESDRMKGSKRGVAAERVKGVCRRSNGRWVSTDAS